jgi:enolase
MNLMTDCKIQNVYARQIFDSRGMPTVETGVLLSCGIKAIASVPSGASTGVYEACELRDNSTEYNGKSVYQAVDHVNQEIAYALDGMRADNQEAIDRQLMKLDGSETKKNLGANAILAVSLACARAAAKAYSIPLYRYLGGSMANLLPIPMMNILNGGAHASNNLDIQEFMIVPIGCENFRDAMRAGVETYHALKKLLKDENRSIAVGDEGGFAPDLENDEVALNYLLRAIEQAGYQPGKDIQIALDIAASEWSKGDDYYLPKAKKQISAMELENYYKTLIQKYPIYSIEDPFSENDWNCFSSFTETTAGIQIVGDDLFVTNPSRVKFGISKKAANAVLIKPNQIGTLSQTIETIRIAQTNGYAAILSHRSGETEDTFIADLAVAFGTGQIKTGAPARGERICKYNRLLRIENALGSAAKYGKYS